MSEKELLKKAKEYAEKGAGLKLNPNEVIANAIVKGLARNREKYGAAYCPCRPVTGDKGKDKLIICPCIYHKDEITRDGCCHCRLFVKD